MTLQDLFITPIYLILLYGVAFAFRSRFTNVDTKPYFIPALSVKFLGAIALGVVYQFYYGGGDTFNYFTHGSKWIWEAFLDDPAKGIQLLFENGSERQGNTFQYSQHIWYYGDPKSYTIVRIAAFFDLLTFHTYSATALFFAFFSFTGSWQMYRVFYKIYPGLKKGLAIAILFIPSVFFWGSGILKDTITLGALGWAVYFFFQIFYFNRSTITNGVLLLFFLYLIYAIKVYILMSFLLAAFVYIYSVYIARVQSKVFRITLAPILLVAATGGGYFTLNSVVSDDSRYSLDNIAKTAQITAYDIRYGWGARTGDTSGYTLGQLDGTFGSMIRLAPAAINVSLFRPYLWEVKNPLMLLSAIESAAMLFITIYLIIKGRKNLGLIFNDPQLRFCLVFALIFAFAVGVSTYNFGTLMRYKIPMMAMYGSFLVVLGNMQTKY